MSKPAGCLCGEEINKQSNSVGGGRLYGNTSERKKLTLTAVSSSFKPGPPCSPDARFSRTHQPVGSVKETLFQAGSNHSKQTRTWCTILLLVQHHVRGLKTVRTGRSESLSPVKCAARNVYNEMSSIWNNRKDMLGRELLQGGLRLLLEDQSGFTLARVLHHLHLHLFNRDRVHLK